MSRAFLNSIYQSGLAAGLSDVQAQLMAAQAAHESGNGAHAPGNNFFGIKAGGNWNGATQSLMTSEEVGGRNVRMRQDFRKYDSPEQAIQDRISFMQQKFPDAFNAKDINSAVAGLQHGRFGSYATDSNYAQKLQPYLSALSGNPSPYAGLLDGPKGQESYPDPQTTAGILGGHQAPQSILGNVPQDVADYATSDDEKSPLQKLFAGLAQYPDAPAPRMPQMGDARSSGDGLLKFIQSLKGGRS